MPGGHAVIEIMRLRWFRERWRFSGAIVLVIAIGAMSIVGDRVGADPISPTVGGAAIFASPSTGLIDGQVISVTGTGYPASAYVAIIQCHHGSITSSGCDMSTLGYFTAGTDGSISTTTIARSNISTADGSFDCSAPDSCHLGVGVVPDGNPSAIAPIEVASFSFDLPTMHASSDLTCSSPYRAYSHRLTSDPVNQTPPGISGDVQPFTSAGATIDVVRSGAAVELTVTLDGTTRRFTTAPYELGGNEDRTPSGARTPFGRIDIVRSSGGAVFVTLSQAASGAYTQVGWRFDDPCDSSIASNFTG
jgi:hypothetical protein